MGGTYSGLMHSHVADISLSEQYHCKTFLQSQLGQGMQALNVFQGRFLRPNIRSFSKMRARSKVSLHGRGQTVAGRPRVQQGRRRQGSRQGRTLLLGALALGLQAGPDWVLGWALGLGWG